MEFLSLSPLSLWGSIVAAAMIGAYFLYSSSQRSKEIFRKLGVRGPRSLPLIGTMHEYLKQSIPHGDVTRSKAYGKVYGLLHGATPTLVIGNVDLAQEVLIKEFASFSDRSQFRAVMQKPLDRSITIACGAHWRHMRNKIAPTFSSGKLKLMMGTIRDCAATLVSYVDKNVDRPITPKDLFSGFTMDVIAGTAFGLDVKSLENPQTPFLEYAKDLFSGASIRHPLRLLALIVALMSERLSLILSKLGLRVLDPSTVKYMEDIVKDALKSTRNDSELRANFAQLCVSQLVDIDKVNPNTIKKTTEGVVWTTEGLLIDDIVSNSIIFLLAGFDTTATFLSFFCYVMATHPEIQEKLHEEIKNQLFDGEPSYDQLKSLSYLGMCMDEVLRMYPPAPRLDRMCNSDVTIGSMHIPLGANIAIPVYAIHHDPDYWPDPEAFIPERFSAEAKDKIHPCAYMPFGAGPRNCIAARLAVLEAKAALVALLRKYKIYPGGELPKEPLKFAVSLGLLTTEKPIPISFKLRRDS